ncbi:MAG: hypothetical protein J2P21_25885, partial [Chloracidobacterium sp.]|nr:hypothetical protein [Chloracidobacterium sp.]
MKRKLVLLILLVAVFAAAQSCKYLFKSDYAELKASDLTAYVDARFPDMYKRQIAQNEMARKKFIDQCKRSFAFAQAAEAAGLQKSDDFKKLSEFRTEQILAAKYMESNPEVIVSKEESDAYYASHKDQFDSDVKFV